MVHLADIMEKPKPAHMTLIDIQPASVARVIMVLSLLHQIAEAQLHKDTDKRLLLYTTLFYLYSALLMPDYFHQV